MSRGAQKIHTYAEAPGVGSQLCVQVGVRHRTESRGVRRRTIMAALSGIVQRISALPIISTRRSGRLAHLLLAVALEVDLVHGGGCVAQRLRDGRVRVSSQGAGVAAMAQRRRVGAGLYARRPMAAQRVVVGALWKELAVVVASKVRYEWPGKLQMAQAGEPQVPGF